MLYAADYRLMIRGVDDISAYNVQNVDIYSKNVPSVIVNTLRYSGAMVIKFVFTAVEAANTL